VFLVLFDKIVENFGYRMNKSEEFLDYIFSLMLLS